MDVKNSALPIFDGYDIHKSILIGNNFAIHRAFSTELNQTVVIKTSIGNVQESLQTARLSHEYALLKDLRIAGIPEVLKPIKNENQHAIIFKFKENIPCKEYVNQQQPDLNSLLQVAINLCNIIAGIHASHIIHQNISSDHIFINPDTLEVELVEFGLATKSLVGQFESPGIAVLQNSLAYISPEQTGRMNRPVDYRSDLYSLGVLLFEMFTNTLPFAANHPLEWVYVHLAQAPPNPKDLKNDLPDMLVKIILTLLAKSSEDRYQSAFNLMKDLEKCAVHSKQNNSIPDFKLACDNTYGLFMLPAKLYGREQELKLLTNTIYESVNNKQAGIITVAGYSGIGKTALINEARKLITVARGFFTASKFDQLNKGIPYLGFTMAFNDLAKQLLAQREEELLAIKNELLEALGGNVQIINQLIPSFELILGKHEPPPLLLPDDTASRFIETVKIFIKTIASPSRPFIIFFDDLQWVDISSLNLLELICTDDGMSGLIIIGSYRNNEVDNAHPLAVALNKLNQKATITEIELHNLNQENVYALLKDSFEKDEKETGELSQLLIEKTEGNPFFIIQALSEWCNDDYISFDISEEKWNWDYQVLKSMNITDNVVELMISRIKKLPSAAQEVLKLAACIGNEFSMKLLASIAPSEMLLSLKETLQQGFITAKDENHILLSDTGQIIENFYGSDFRGKKTDDAQFKFQHDRVQHAAYSLLNEQQTTAIHLQIGQNLSRQLNESEKTEQIFTICNHLNQGKSLLLGAEEKMELAALNNLACKRAKDATAYDKALEYGTVGIQLLPNNAIQNCFSLWQSLNFSTAECNYLLGQWTDAENKFRTLLEHSTSRNEKIVVYRAMVDMYSTSINHFKVIDTIRKAVELFGHKMPDGNMLTKLGILSSIFQLKWKLRKSKPEELAVSKICTDPDEIKLIELTSEAGPSFYQANQDLFAWLVLYQTKCALTMGITPSTTMAITGYGMIMNAAFGDLESAFRMAAVGEKMNLTLGDAYSKHKLKFVQTFFINHFKYEVIPHIDAFLLMSNEAKMVGDSMYFGMNYCSVISYKAAIGENLNEVFNECSVLVKQLEQLNNSYAYELSLCRYYALLLLLNKPIPGWETEPAINAKIEMYKKQLAHTNLTYLYTSIYQLNVLCGNYESKLKEHILDGFGLINYIVGTYMYAEFALYQSICCYLLLQKEGNTNAKELTKVVHFHSKTLANRAKNGPSNYKMYAQLQLVFSKLCQRKKSEAIDLLNAIIGEERKTHFRHLMALACEWKAKISLEDNNQNEGQNSIITSIGHYQKWGALKKLELMNDQYPTLTLNMDNELIAQLDSKNTLDMTSLMKSSIEISSEIVLDKLLPSLINIIVENAGASKGFLALTNNEDLLLSVKKEALQQNPVALNNLPVEQCNELSQQIVKYVARTSETVMCNKAFFDERFKNDEYIQSNKAKSILCVPITYKSKMNGVIYLENDLVTHAFTEDRINVIKILSAQIAISIDNALLYQNLQNSLDSQVALTKAYSRFTPMEYLKFLGHNSILDVKLGDHRVENMTVLFSDIRSYTTLAEQFTAEENFAFLSAYLEKMTEVVTNHHGLVNQLLGDGILAFFSKPEDALDAAVEMQKKLQTYTVKLKNGNTIQVKAGIGIHEGEVIIGIMGNANSMDTGIVSDTVNAASRIESLTKHFGVNILISESVAEKLNAEARNRLRFVGRIKVKGKDKDIGLFENFDGDLATARDKKEVSQKEFHDAMDNYMNMNFNDAATQFAQLAALNIEDTVIYMYLEKSKKMMHTEVPADWSPVESMDLK